MLFPKEDGRREKTPAINVVKYDGPANSDPWVVYKCPSDRYVLGSQLIVNQGQEAIFFRGGEACDLFGPGTHTLRTGNLPLLNRITNLPFGGDTPFAAEVYFVNKTANLDMCWGTTTPIPIEDPHYGILLNIGAHGQYGISVEDSRLFVTRIVGAMPNGTAITHKTIARYFNTSINALIKSVVSQYVSDRKLSFLEVSSYLSEISELLQCEAADEFDRFGIRLISFICSSIAPKPEEYEKLRGYKEELALGDAFYQQRRSFDILERLAENPSSGSIANMGIGLGMGIGTAQQFGTMFSSMGHNVGEGSQSQSAGVSCPSCGNQNDPSSKFCTECGCSLASRTCQKCGHDNASNAKFCSGCGYQLIG